MKNKEAFSFNEKGKRDNQEDSVFPQPHTSHQDGSLFIVCDGMGGYAKGEVASRIVCDSIAEYLLQKPKNAATLQHINNAIECAQSKIDEYITANKESAGMGTTLAMLYFADGSAYAVHIGDSRVYHIRNGKTLWVSWDHSKVNDLIKAGLLTPEKAKDSKRNVITRSMQGNLVRKTEADVTFINDISPGDFFLICSDGVWDCFEDADLALFFTANESNPAKLDKIKAVCEQNSNDNYTACLIEVAGTVTAKHLKNGNKSKKKKTVFILIVVAFCLIVMAGAWYKYAGTNTKSKSGKTQKKEQVIKQKDKKP